MSEIVKSLSIMYMGSIRFYLINLFISFSNLSFTSYAEISRSDDCYWMKVIKNNNFSPSKNCLRYLKDGPFVGVYFLWSFVERPYTPKCLKARVEIVL